MIGFGGHYGDDNIHNEITVINVKPSTTLYTPGSENDNDTIECPLCGGDILPQNMVKSCSNNVKGHNVCRTCQTNLTTDYFKGKRGCIYCGDRPSPNEDSNTINISISVQPNVQNVSVVVGNNNDSDCGKWCKDTLMGLCITMGLVAIYLLCCCVFHMLKWMWILIFSIDEDFNLSKVNLSFLSALGGCFIISFITIININFRRTLESRIDHL